MSDEDKKWLEDAMNALSNETDPVKLMKQNIKTLSSLNLRNPSEEEKIKGVACLETINDLCDQIDNASDFIKIGGLRVIIPLLASSFPNFRCLSAELIGNLSQNHPYCQEKLNEFNTLEVLFQLLDYDADNEVKLKALYAISCLIRQNEKLQTNFIELGGINYLLRALQPNNNNNERLKAKTSFLLAQLFRHNDKSRQIALNSGIIEVLLPLLDSNNGQVRENVTSALLALVENNPDAVKVFRQSNLGIMELVLQKMDAIKNIPEFADEFSAYETIYKTCWSAE